MKTCSLNQSKHISPTSLPPIVLWTSSEHQSVMSRSAEEETSLQAICVTLSLQVVLSEAQAVVQQQYAAIREALEQEEESALQCVRKEEERVLEGLEEKLGHLRSSLLAIQQGLHSMEGLADAKGDNRIQDQAFIVVCSVSEDKPAGG